MSLRSSLRYPLRSSLRSSLAPPLLAAALLVALAGPAAAHVRVSSPDAAPGGFGKLVFRVPTESDTASTTKVQVTLPTGTPFAFVSTRPLPGWTVTTAERTLEKPLKVEGFTLTKAVSTVTWTASRDAAVPPGAFQEFEMSVGPFPEKAGEIELPTTQTYSDGEVVAWDEPTPASGEEPEHPAPVLDLVKAADPVATPDASTTSTATASSDDPLGRWLGGGGLALGAIALVVALVRRPRVVGG